MGAHGRVGRARPPGGQQRRGAGSAQLPRATPQSVCASHAESNGDTAPHESREPERERARGDSEREKPGARISCCCCRARASDAARPLLLRSVSDLPVHTYSARACFVDAVAARVRVIDDSAKMCNEADSRLR